MAAKKPKAPEVSYNYLMNPKTSGEKKARPMSFAAIDDYLANVGGGVGSFLTQEVPVGESTTAPAEVPATSEGEPDTSGGGRKWGWNGSRLQAPQSSPSVTMATTARYNKGTAARLILLSMGVAGGAILVRGSGIPAYQADVNGKKVQVPGNLHAFAGVVIAGTIALVVNEVSPDLGMVFAVGLVFVAIWDVQVFTSLGQSIFAGGKPVAPAKRPTTGKGTPAQNPMVKPGQTFGGPNNSIGGLSTPWQYP